ncbi:Inner membrane protein YhaI [Mycobacteroides salmoniphilum]|uniref:Inner membrane protein YhaI n=1 Tax=Mycobacteroides salmoniphilum TaxID=404941 RepID=A0A4R8S2J9_9MYCO|nr:DUF805 domain-containing protein [Mycobacteroides salmoniphilum]TDZ82109.1 Inner membrane protein YhaI [Mycobacteroides salmoniphilum]
MTYGQPPHGGQGEPERDDENGQPNHGHEQPQSGPPFGEQFYPPAYPAAGGYSGGYFPPPNLGAQDPKDLTLPLYDATLNQAVSRFFGNYATFSGRASKSEYWWATLASCLAVAALILLGAIAAAVIDIDAVSALFAIVLILFGLVLTVPTISLAVRRLHDANLSGWLYLLSFIPLVNYFTWIVFGLLSTNPAGARYDAR